MNRRSVVAIVLVLVVLGLPIATTGWQLWTSAAETRKKSAVLALMDEIERTATLHYDQFGAYPATMNEMKTQVFPDGSSSTMLDEIDYQSDGKTMTLEWHEFRLEN